MLGVREGLNSRPNSPVLYVIWRDCFAQIELGWKSQIYGLNSEKIIGFKLFDLVKPPPPLVNQRWPLPS